MRITERDEFGNADIIGIDSSDLQLNLDFDEFNKVTEALNRLADYEDTNLMPKEIVQLKTENEAAMNELKYYGDCTICKYNQIPCPREARFHEQCFLWRGVPS